MTPAPGFFLHHGNDLPALADALGAVLAAGNDRDWLQPDTVLIPQPSMRRWLQNSLAEQTGIAANLDFQLPGQLLDAVLQPWLPAPDPAMLLNGERCRWRIFTLLLDDGLMANPAFAGVKRFLHTDDRPLRAWQLAGELAQAFEKYQAWRRDWLLSWHRKAVPGDWQSILWHLASQGRTFRAQAVEAYLTSLVNPGCPRPSGLPDHLSVFACQNLSPDVVRILQSFGRWIRVEFFLHNPCEAYWGDSGQKRSASDVMAMAFDNPLLDQWGYAGRDFVASLLSEQSAEWLGEAEHYRRPPGDAEPTLLQCLQDDVLSREAPKAGRMTRQALLSDASIQIHCCAGALREVQMLRGQLLDLLQRNPALQWRDIVIMAPDLDRFAPYFAPVFGQTTADYPALPFALSETAAGNGLQGLVFRVLALARSRFTGNDGYELLTHPLLAASYDLSPDDLERLHAWLEQAGVRWGFDARHRMQIEGVSQQAFTWRFALERLIYGYASSDALIGDTAPVAMPAGKDRRLLDVLLAFTARIDRLQKQLNEAHDAEAWQEILQGLLAWLVADKTLEAADLAFFEQLQRLVSGLRDLADNAGLSHPFPVGVIASWLTEALEPRLGQAWLSGKITVCKMVPMRLIPFKVVCVLGMDQSAFPRPEPVAAINRLADRATAARTGDRSNRNDDRFLMLQLLSACRAHWIIGYSGLNPADGSESPPATVIQELRRTMAAYGPGDADTEAALTIRHPIHAFETPADSRIAVVRADAVKHPAVSEKAPLFAEIAGIDDKVSTATPLDIELSEFLRFWRSPMEALARRLNIRWQWRDRLLDASEPLGKASGLARYRLVQTMAAALLENPDADPAILLHRLQAEGMLAPGRAGQHSFQRVLAEIAPALKALSEDAMAPTRFDMEFLHDGLRMHGQLIQRHKSGIVMLALHRPELSPKMRVAAGLQALLAKAGNLDAAVGVRTAKKFHGLSLSCSPEQARGHLDTLLGYYRTGQERILCFDPEASFAWYAFNARNPNADVGAWIEQHSAQDEPPSGKREPGLDDVLTEGGGFLQAVAAREPEAFKHVSHTVCSILNGDAA
jgi:exodeoxyribonuclease V gamma subunit